jgi:hypothetical protein
MYPFPSIIGFLPEILLAIAGLFTLWRGASCWGEANQQISIGTRGAGCFFFLMGLLLLLSAAAMAAMSILGNKII